MILSDKTIMQMLNEGTLGISPLTGIVIFFCWSLYARMAIWR